MNTLIIWNSQNVAPYLINEIKKEYADYLDEFPECSTLLNNLEKVKQDLEEKEFEIATIKKEQKKNLEKNNAKVLKYQKD